MQCKLHADHWFFKIDLFGAIQYLLYPYY